MEKIIWIIGITIAVIIGGRRIVSNITQARELKDSLKERRERLGLTDTEYVPREDSE